MFVRDAKLEELGNFFKENLRKIRNINLPDQSEFGTDINNYGRQNYWRPLNSSIYFLLFSYKQFLKNITCS
mgnify:CR=1 FL=1